jgi:hypothetical protein
VEHLAQLHAPDATLAGAKGDGDSFNAHTMRAGTGAILYALSDRLDALVGHADRPPPGADESAYVALGLRSTVRQALRPNEQYSKGPSVKP